MANIAFPVFCRHSDGRLSNEQEKRRKPRRRRERDKKRPINNSGVGWARIDSIQFNFRGGPRKGEGNVNTQNIRPDKKGVSFNFLPYAEWRFFRDAAKNRVGREIIS